jgi:hypothetical protein
MFLLAFAVCRWRYEGLVQGLRERIEALKDHLGAKDAQLDEYRERLHLVPASGSKFSRLTHTELKAKALEFVRNLRDWLARSNAEDREKGDREWSAMVSAPDDAERKRLWDESNAASSQRSAQLSAEYDATYKVDAILLRDEMLSRLPSDSTRRRQPRLYYEHSRGPFIMERVADDLEQLAKCLN